MDQIWSSADIAVIDAGIDHRSRPPPNHAAVWADVIVLAQAQANP